MSDESKPKPRGAYHHGDLSRALVEAAAGIIAEQGADALTLREVGQRVGVSRTAMYRHFDDKAALVEAVALEGFRMLRGAVETSLAGEVGDSGEQLARLSEAYLQFGSNHPPHYRTMFGPALRGHDRNPELKAEGMAAFRLLVDVILRGQAAGHLISGDAVRIAQVSGPPCMGS